MKTKEELHALKNELDALKEKLVELNEDELADVTGGMVTTTVSNNNTHTENHCESPNNSAVSAEKICEKVCEEVDDPDFNTPLETMLLRPDNKCNLRTRIVFYYDKKQELLIAKAVEDSN